MHIWTAGLSPISVLIGASFLGGLQLVRIVRSNPSERQTPNTVQKVETPAAAPSGGDGMPGSPNFKRFRKHHAADAQRPVIGFAAASYAQEVQAKDFLRYGAPAACSCSL